MYQTSAVANKYFNRTFSLRDYYYCTTDTKVWFSNTSSNSCYQVLVGEKNKTVCSFLTLSRSVIFVGDLDNSTNINRELLQGEGGTEEGGVGIEWEGGQGGFNEGGRRVGRKLSSKD